MQLLVDCYWRVHRVPQTKSLRVSVLQPIAQLMLADRVFAHHISRQNQPGLGSILAKAAHARSFSNSDSKRNRSGSGSETLGPILPDLRASIHCGEHTSAQR
jgi:hypothetical protein